MACVTSDLQGNDEDCGSYDDEDNGPSVVFQPVADDLERLTKPIGIRRIGHTRHTQAPFTHQIFERPTSL